MQRKDFQNALTALEPYIELTLLENPHLFSDLLYRAISEWQIPEQELRDTFGLSHGAVEKWTTGKNLPQPNIRPYVLKWIYQFLKARMNETITIVD